jgi:uncharacterized protein YjbI with pentapeptide repeats
VRRRTLGRRELLSYTWGVVSRAHLSVLRAGRDDWNAWRHSHPRIIPNLRNARLAGEQLAQYNFYGTDLSKADLSSANLHRAAFGRASLHGTQFRGANLHRVVLSGAEIDRANFDRAILIDADLSFCEIEHANV